jgi:Mrp family chromosome partitioning ATPase
MVRPVLPSASACRQAIEEGAPMPALISKTVFSTFNDGAIMIITVGNTKGGVGKTTLAVQLAIARALAGRDVWLIDGDRQGTAAAAIAARAEAGVSRGLPARNTRTARPCAARCSSSGTSGKTSSSTPAAATRPRYGRR